MLDVSVQLQQIPEALSDAWSLARWTDVEQAGLRGSSPWRLVGMGGSYNAAAACVPRFLQHGVPARAQLASELIEEGFGTIASDERILLVSNTGESHETVAAAEGLTDCNHKHLFGLTNDASSTLAALVPAHGLLHVDEDCLGLVAFAATCSALAELAAAVSGTPEESGLNVRAAAEATYAASQALLERDPTTPSQVDVIARPALYGIAAQIALIVREIARIPASAWEAGNYRHGPIESIDAGQLMLVVGSDDQAARDAKLAAYLRTINERTVAVGWCGADVFARSDHSGLMAVLDLVPGTLLAYRWARSGDYQPGEFRYTTRTILADL